MDRIGTTLSNLIRDQFPENYREHGPLLVAFVEAYYRWLETQQPSRDNWFIDKTSLVAVQSKSANIIGKGTFFTTQFSKGDSIAVSKGSETTDYEIFTVKSIANDVFLTLTSDRLPEFTHANTRYATISDKPNAVFLTRNFFELHDVDETFDEFLVHFKEKYLKDLQFKTITNTRKLVKHSLDLYRSKGTERSLDLLYKIVFGKPAKVYYPGQDIFRLSSGEWFIPRYLELCLSHHNSMLINRQVVGVISGATAFVEEIIRRVIGNRIIEVAYISAINGTFITGEKITLSDNSLDMAMAPTIVGSLNKLDFDIAGSGANFEINEPVEIESTNGRGALGKVIGTSNSAGQILFSLGNGGYGFSNTIQVANTTGNVAVVSSNSFIIGNGTLFQSEYSVGDYISVWSSPVAYTTHQITNITSNTELQVDTAWAFTNAQTKSAFTRYFAQTFISDKIITISNATFTDSYLNFEYMPFLDTVTQPIGVINYENANGTFTVGEHIFTYTGGTEKGQGVILTNTKKTTNSGVLTISVLSGNCEADAIYTTANAIGANLSIANGYTDTSASGHYIGNYANVAITTNNVYGSFGVGHPIIQPETEASGIITNVRLQDSNCVIEIANSIGIFRNGFTVSDSNTLASATVLSIRIDVGVANVSGVFSTIPNNYVHSSHLSGTVSEISLGSGAAITFSNTLIYPEEVSINTDYIYPLLSYQLGATAWPFSGDPTANLQSHIGDVLSYSDLTIGKVLEIAGSSPGVGYTKAPIIRLHEPSIFHSNLPDLLLLNVSNTSGFTLGEVITQEDSDARGLIEEIVNSESLRVQNLRFYSNDAFIATSNSTTTIVGVNSGYVSNVVSVIPFTMSSRFGSDVVMLSDLVVAEGAITDVQILDSGFAFANGEQVTIRSGDKDALGYAVLETHGTGSGYYKSSDGFLSDVKKLSDGWYWQEYSYEVRSSVIDDFKKILKQIVHVAGTKSFDALIYDTISSIEPTIETTLTIT